MAKKSAVERNDKRKRLVEKYAAKREELKAIALNEDLPLEERFKARLKRVGYRGLAAENIARGQKSLGRVLAGWMKSPGHRRNMLHPRMRYFGLAAAKNGGRNYWAMVLGG